MCCDTAGCVILRALAAFVKFICLHTAKKVSSLKSISIIKAPFFPKGIAQFPGFSPPCILPNTTLFPDLPHSYYNILLSFYN